MGCSEFQAVEKKSFGLHQNVKFNKSATARTFGVSRGGGVEWFLFSLIFSRKSILDFDSQKLALPTEALAMYFS